MCHSTARHCKTALQKTRNTGRNSELGWEILCQLPYSPDLATSDYPIQHFQAIFAILTEMYNILKICILSAYILRRSATMNFLFFFQKLYFNFVKQCLFDDRRTSRRQGLWSKHTLTMCVCRIKLFGIRSFGCEAAVKIKRRT